MCVCMCVCVCVCVCVYDELYQIELQVIKEETSKHLW